MAVWHIQRWKPLTCECHLLQKFDAEANPRVVTLFAIEKACPGHPMPSAPENDVGLWHDGNWYGVQELIKKQKEWTKWRVRERAVAELRRELPLGPSREPQEPPTKPTPSAAHREEFDQTYLWSVRDEKVFSLSREMAINEAKIDRSTPEANSFRDNIFWWFEGIGEERQLHLDFQGSLSSQHHNNISAAVDIQFGMNRLVIEG